jgi:hypothetical protein
MRAKNTVSGDKSDKKWSKDAQKTGIDQHKRIPDI